MCAKSIAELPGRIYNLIEGLDENERRRVINAALALLGDPAPSSPVKEHGAGDTGEDSKGLSPKAYFAEKEPKTKKEKLAVAARFLEVSGKLEEYDKDAIKDVFTKARENFDDNNFKRDVENAKRQSGLFIRGSGKMHRLSYSGQQFVDALPDREAAKKWIKVKKANRKKKKGKEKKKAAKK